MSHYHDFGCFTCWLLMQFLQSEVKSGDVHFLQAARKTAKKQNPNSNSLRCQKGRISTSTSGSWTNFATLQSFWAKEKATKSEGFQLQTNFLHWKNMRSLGSTSLPVTHEHTNSYYIAYAIYIYICIYRERSGDDLTLAKTIQQTRMTDPIFLHSIPWIHSNCWGNCICRWLLPEPNLIPNSPERRRKQWWCSPR